jgi:hypothetical protein
MKRLLIIVVLSAYISFAAKSQIVKPVTWSYAAKKTSATTATIYLKATIEEGWHLYSQFVKEGGPVKTTFTFPKAKNYSLIGTTTEQKPIERYEEMFKMKIGYFETSALFQQKVKLIGKKTIVKGKVEFMVCNDKQCLPPEEVEFMITVK